MIVRQSPAKVALLTVASAGYIAAKWSSSPILYLARRAGWKATWPRRLDAAVNRLVMPLTESADDRQRCEVTPALRPGDLIPDVPVGLPDGRVCSARSFAGRPLLLVAIRGSWCPYSRLHLADLNATLPDLEAEDVRVLAVSSHADSAWWQRHGVRIPVAADPDGNLFQALGVLKEDWIDTAWGRVLPYEGVFLFDAGGRLVTADVRNVSGIHLRQTFLSGRRWVQIARVHAGRS